MDKKKHNLIIGSLLHDIGKVSFRAFNLQEIKSHSIAGYEWLNLINPNVFKLDNIGSMIKHHHRNKMPDFGKGMREDDLAFLTSIADHISAGSDRREKEDFNFDDIDFTESQTKVPLESIFSILEPKSEGYHGYAGKNLAYNPSIRYPEKDNKISDYDYNDVLSRLKELFKNEELFTDSKNINSLVSIIKAHFKYLPSDTRYQMRNDISLAEHSLTTAAFASALYDYFNEHGITNYYEQWSNENKLFKEKTFLFVSFDFSGIQKFVFDIPVEGALKNLRVRSFYLEMLAEIFVDSLLLDLELSRANVIYVGGGHGYLILPNTKKAKASYKEHIEHFNNFFLNEFNYNLYLASSLVEVSPNDLISINNKGEHTNSFKEVMSEIFKQTSESKASRFNYDVLKKLNFTEKLEINRECSICGNSNKLKNVNDRFICEMCNSFLCFSDDLVDDENIIYLVSEEKLKNKDYLLFPFKEKHCYLSVVNKEEFKKMDKEKILFSYVKNDFIAFSTQSTSIFVADYAVKDEKGRQLAINEIIALEEKGIKRISVMKLDVDSLGEVFKNKFPNKMYTISRMTSLSAHLSIYFKYYINELLKNLNITVIFSGGDDAFLIGTFKDILKFSKVIYESFKKYTLNKITFSAGIGLFQEKYPIYKISTYVEDLLLKAKSVEGKNSVSIFDTSQVFKWEEFFNSISGDGSYLNLINFNIEKELISQTLLYNSIYYPLKNLKDDKKTVYRFAYMLGRKRKENEDKLKDEKLRDKFNELEQVLMTSANYQNKKIRENFLLAIQVYMYLNRKKEN
ncbi:MAG: type III-A CRISPR-associated protein Cas10/Csm1 [Acholeplasmataceae bacterium]|jgi:CRISPR-associated protein Csm1|nr:type III-A CRISPR-associated protein Cas10/Csm1 [Acholeplasmataceae bacterium]